MATKQPDLSDALHLPAVRFNEHN